MNVSKEITITSEKHLKIWNESSPICPHCLSPFGEWPQRKRKCKNCREDVYVKKHPSTEKWSIINKSTAESWEREWEKKNFIKRWLAVLTQYGILESDYYNILEQGKDSYRDIIWGLFNRALSISVGNFHDSRMLYLHMAVLVCEEGKDPTYLIEACREVELQEIEIRAEESRVLTGEVKILTTSNYPNKCSNCLFLDGKILTLEQARMTKPLPHRNCELKYCLGMYLPVIKKRI